MESGNTKTHVKKTGLDLVHSNYWPFSNLPFLSNVLEKVVLDQLNLHYDICCLNPEYQSAN